MQLIDVILDWIARICAGLATVAVGWTALFYVAEVVARYGLSHPLNWAGDNGSYMLCVIAFMILPALTRNRNHITVTILVDQIPEAKRKVALRILDFVTAVVLATVSWFVIELCVRQFHQGTLTSQANQIPRWWLTAIMSMGLVLSAINFLFPPRATDSRMVEEL